MKKIRLVVLSGPSGSGKSTVVKSMEDLGFYCVDNMPVALLPRFMELVARSGEITKVAAVVDVREREFLKAFAPVFAELKDACHHVELIYLEASDDALVRRFSETRRRHPLADAESPLDGIRAERELLEDLKAHADRVIDTTHFNVHQLRDAVRELFSSVEPTGKMTVSVVSFGYRYGVPADADIVMDIRFLPNPYFVESLKWLDGTDRRVREFVTGRPETAEFLARFKAFLEYLLPLYGKEGKSYLSIAVGCTGGKHRSVVIVDELAGAMASSGVDLKKRHRDISKP